MIMIHRTRASFLAAVLAALALQVSVPAAAEDDPLSKATSAVTEIIFDYNAEEFVTYNVRDNGYLDVTFARNTPDAVYNEMLEKLRKHPDIKGVLAGKGGPACSRF
jgi:ABC-type sugar transport system substrate-binding protein